MTLCTTISVMGTLDGLARKLLISRRNMGWNQDELADRAGVSRTYVSDIEREKAKNVGIDVVMALAEALSVSPSYLLGETDNPSPEFDDTEEDNKLFGIPPWKRGADAAIKTLGNRLLISRRDLALTQGQLAEKVGISASYVSNIESGKVKSVSADILVALAKALDVAVAYLLGETEYPLLDFGEEGVEVLRETVIVYEVADPQEVELIEMIQKMDSEQKQQMLWGARLLLGGNQPPRIIE